ASGTSPGAHLRPASQSALVLPGQPDTATYAAALLAGPLYGQVVQPGAVFTGSPAVAAFASAPVTGPVALRSGLAASISSGMANPPSDLDGTAWLDLLFPDAPTFVPDIAAPPEAMPGPEGGDAEAD